MTTFIIDGKTYSGEEVADMLYESDHNEDVDEDALDNEEVKRSSQNKMSSAVQLLDPDIDLNFNNSFVLEDEIMVNQPHSNSPANFIEILDNKTITGSTHEPSTSANLTWSAPINANNEQIETRDEFSAMFANVVVDRKDSAFEKPIWKKRNLLYSKEQIKFHGDSSLPPTIAEISTPFKCFMFFWSEEIELKTVEQSLLYSLQNNQSDFKFERQDLRDFIAIIYIMSVVRLPSVRDYWGPHGYNKIKDIMSINRFEKIRRYIHFNDKTKRPDRENKERDHLYNVRPIIDHLNANFEKVPKLDRLSIDEQMCSTKIGHYLKMYLPNKPKKWGFKLYVLCDTYGFAYKFEVYVGCECDMTKVLVGEPDLGATSNVVVRLTRNIPKFKNHIVFFDNFYTSIPLVAYLRTLGILSVGTIRRNRIKCCKLPEEKDMMKLERGTSREFVASIHGIDNSILSWKDNRVVNLVSTYVGMQPFSNAEEPQQPITVRRFDRKKKSWAMVPCPQVIKEYNAHMGGVDLMDSHLGRHKIPLKSRKWTNRLFFHLLDITMINAWLLYKRVNHNCRDFTPLRQSEFRMKIAEALVNVSKDSKKRGRPSGLEKEFQQRVKRPNATPIPGKDIRMDGFEHWPAYTTQGRCALCKEGKTTNMCTKCDVRLCYTAKKNCFYDFHNK